MKQALSPPAHIDEREPTSEAPRAQVSGAMVRALVDLIQQRGFAPELLLGGSSPARGRLDTALGERTTLREFQRLLSRAIELTGRPALAIECGLHAAEASYGLISPLISHTTTLRHALQMVAQFHSLLLDDARVRVEERLDLARVQVELPRTHSPADQGIIELSNAGLVRTLRAFGCAPRDLRAVCFEYARPAHHASYAHFFGGAERFEQPFNGVEFARHLLDRPHIHRQPELERLLREQAERGLESLARPSTWTDRVRALAQRDGAELDMASAAHELGLSVRSLRRRLQDEGTSYRALTQAVLHESACAMLRNPELTLQAISHALGFADSMTFHHTFKRWTQSTPTTYREQALRTPTVRASSTKTASRR